MGKKKIWTFTFLIISFFLVFYLLKDLKFKDFLTEIREVKWLFVFISSLCMLISAWFRNLRWLKLFEPLGYKIKKKQAFVALLMSYPANLIIPQSSFFVRAGYLKKISGVPFIECLGTIIAEKLMDGIVVFGLFLVIVLPSLTTTITISNDYIFYLIVLISGFALCFFSLFVFKRYYRNLWAKINDIIWGQLTHFKQGLLSTMKVEDKFSLFLFTFAIWIPYFLIYYFLLNASVLSDLKNFRLPIELSIMANIGWIFPTQGGIGSYHYFVTKIMETHHFTKLQSVFFAFFSHSFIIFNDIILGVFVVIMNRKVVFSLLNKKND